MTAPAMKTKPRIILALIIGLIGWASTASAHYLWVTLSAKSGQHGTTKIYFEGGPGPGTGEHLDPFIDHGTTWIRTVNNPMGLRVKMEVGKKPKSRWLTALLPGAAPRSIDSHGKWGVYRYGKTDVRTHEDLHELAQSEKLELDIVPHEHGGTMELKVLWRGKLAAGRTVYIRGPKGFKKNPKTNDAGEVKFKPEADGRYLFRTNVEEKANGTDGGKEYQLKRYHATLVMNLPLDR